jgi:hypothetical protein
MKKSDRKKGSPSLLVLGHHSHMEGARVAHGVRQPEGGSRGCVSVPNGAGAGASHSQGGQHLDELVEGGGEGDMGAGTRGAWCKAARRGSGGLRVRVREARYRRNWGA